ncbi:MAG: transcriptional regulator NrdR [Patescibacteria group bacterium]|jgi:transcriptional repressor NrdR|nr:transcriptional regulator NrdR [Patescibacteria group bacterium]
MKCPICYFNDTKVVDSRVSTDGSSIRRRRECLKCGFRFSTYEEIELLELVIVKRDGRREAYSRDKLMSGLKKSCEKRPITADRFKRLIHAIERDLQKLKKSEITSKQVGMAVMKNLKKVDQISYIRYASIYESFKDAADFKKELNKLIKNKRIKK